MPVEKSYPYHFALKSFGIFVFGVTLTSLVIWISSYYEPAPTYAENYGILVRLRGEIEHTSILVYAAGLLLTLTGTLIISILYSHKVAGPLYKLGMLLRAAAAGDLTVNARLRRGDVIHPIADDINALISSYRTLASELDVKTELLSGAVDAVKNSAGAVSHEELNKSLADISAKAREVRETLHEIRL